MRTINLLALALVVVGALNWGLVGLASFDLVAWISGVSFGHTTALSRLVYGLVALAGIFEAVTIIGPLRHHSPRPVKA